MFAAEVALSLLIYAALACCAWRAYRRYAARRWVWDVGRPGDQKPVWDSVRLTARPLTALTPYSNFTPPAAIIP